MKILKVVNSSVNNGEAKASSSSILESSRYEELKAMRAAIERNIDLRDDRGLSKDDLLNELDMIDTELEKYEKPIDAHTCCFCGKHIEGYSNNAQPVKDGACCDECNASIVIPARLKDAYGLAEDVSYNASEEKDSLLNYMFELISEYRIFDLANIPSFEEVREYFDDSITKPKYERCVKLLTDAVEGVETYSDDGRTYIQLSDNHTALQLDCDIEPEMYGTLVDRAIEDFKQETGVDLYLLGRSGRHVCVDVNLHNLLNYATLCQVQSKLEKKVINDCREAAGSITESRADKEDFYALNSKRMERIRAKVNSGEMTKAGAIKYVQKMYGKKEPGSATYLTNWIKDGKENGLSESLTEGTDIGDKVYNTLVNSSVYDIIDAMKTYFPKFTGDSDFREFFENETGFNFTSSWKENLDEYDNEFVTRFFYNYFGASELETEAFLKHLEDEGFLIESIAKKTVKESASLENEYVLLDRMRSDCEYYLGCGERCDKHLWAGNVKAQIAKMREIYNNLEVKPEWISSEDIDRYEREMTKAGTKLNNDRLKFRRKSGVAEAKATNLNDNAESEESLDTTKATNSEMADPEAELTEGVIFGEEAIEDKNDYKALLEKYYGKSAVEVAKENDLSCKSVFYFMESHCSFDAVIALKEELENDFSKEEFKKLYD